MKIFFLIFITFFSFDGFTFSSKKRKEINFFIQKEISLIESLEKSSESMEYRLFELYFEEFKMNFEEENEIFIQQRKKNYKFTSSNLIYQKYQERKKIFLKKFKQSNFEKDILYIQAVMARDLNKNDDSLKYFLKSYHLIENSGSNLEYNILTAIADHYYNLKKYSQALIFYQKSLGFRKQEWITKNILNLSWCFFKSKDLNSAIKYSIESFHLSSAGGFIDLREQAIEAILLFYSSRDDGDTPFKFLQEFYSAHIPSYFLLLKFVKERSF